MKYLCCPVCGDVLTREDRTLRCPRGHSFDTAKSGYCNLLMPDRMHAPLPGDNKQMVRARAAFLDGGWYQFLADAVCDAAEEAVPLGGVLLDVGCGEGYYTALLAKRLSGVRVLGTDISKTAADSAAKRTKGAFFFVSSAFHLPILTESLSAVVNLFAPFCREELLRVLQPGGYLLLAVPGRQHLFELKQAIYEKPYENEPQDPMIEGFRLCNSTHLLREMLLPDSETIAQLFTMTPYYYKTSPADMEKLSRIDRLSVTAEFHLFLYQKEASI